MPVTRSATRAATATSVPAQADVAETGKANGRASKRKETDADAPAPVKKSRKKTTAKAEDAAAAPAPAQAAATPVLPPIPPGEPAAFVPAVLTFSFEDAKKHLIDVDRRFEDVFARMKCRPFEHLERVDPFRTLTDSILGQQISWLAARSIRHRFIRLFDPSLPEKPVDYHAIDFFPTAHQVASMDIATLRTAGLSGRKAEYVQDLATRFADGRLSTQKLLEANDTELYKMLIEVRGIGRWTVDMFAIFSLRRPDILPVGDLGVQRGVLRWFLALHDPSYLVAISPKKLPKPPSGEQEEETNSEAEESVPAPAGPARALSPDASSTLPAPEVPSTPAKGKGKRATDDEPAAAMPTPFTPSINKTLNMYAGGAVNAPPPPPLPEGLTPGALRSRLDGKKKIKGALLTPQEMEGLTEPWRPYRSLGVYYMWALAEESK
ncbi:DNA glycosylase [Obba rivulosa]|uniref:DNA glycosylase n=1 Tax=Obba rivulosa TaxID=1052685 RepID=A0A8E2DSM6_9APHY|nr:DNA glycosylase [Obba rivulosa]